MSYHPCAVCGHPLTWVPQYLQYYCYRCQTYYPPGRPARKDEPPEEEGREMERVGDAVRAAVPSYPVYCCSTCGTQLQFIAQYQRWYCYTCRAYR